MSYLDTSVLMSLLLRDVHTAQIRRRFREATSPVHVSVFGVVEFGSVLGVRVRASAIAPAEANRVLTHLDAWLARRAELLDVEPADHRLAAMFVRRFELGLRAPDALHIAVCQRLRVPLLTFDLRQASAAQRLGVACDPAGAAPPQPDSA